MYLKLNPFCNDINNEIINVVQNIILKITIDERISLGEPLYNFNYHTSKKCLDKSKQLLEANIEKDIEITNGTYFSGFDEGLIAEKLLSIVKKCYLNKKVTISGNFYYPYEGYMGWHTNCNKPNKRLYITYASEDKKSFFRYLKNGEIITCYDNKGITIREFDIPNPPDYFWHCVGSKCDRYSFGFKIANIEN